MYISLYIVYFYDIFADSKTEILHITSAVPPAQVTLYCWEVGLCDLGGSVAIGRRVRVESESLASGSSEIILPLCPTVITTVT